MRRVGKYGLSNVKQINPAAEFTCPGFGDAMSALGDNADDPVRPAQEREDLRSLAVFDLAKANASIGGEGHGAILCVRTRTAD